MAESRSLLFFFSSCAATSKRKEETVSSRFRKLSHSIWHCQYHIVWVPKYRFRILQGKVKEAVELGIHAICGYAGCEVVELNVQPAPLGQGQPPYGGRTTKPRPVGVDSLLINDRSPAQN
ncbi:MAG: transposase [Desulfuromonadales bacterium]|nr:transposase [Desulfuromonadales bacterium]